MNTAIFPADEARRLIYEPRACPYCGSFTIWGTVVRYECSDCGALWEHGFRVMLVRTTIREPQPACRLDVPATLEPKHLSRRLAFDPNVSSDSPCVKGTWITVRQLVSLIVDGWSWSEILTTHPELTEDDIRAALAYTVQEEEA